MASGWDSWLVWDESFAWILDLVRITLLMHCPARTAFDPKKNPLNVPIVQVSLLGNEDPDAHYRIGRALEQLRDEGVLIIGAGMAVHNLHDFRKTKSNDKVMP